MNQDVYTYLELCLPVRPSCPKTKVQRTNEKRRLTLFTFLNCLLFSVDKETKVKINICFIPIDSSQVL